MIYCVVPADLAPDLYDRLAGYYLDDPNVAVIIDRRRGERRRGDDGAGADSQRGLRDRRRARVTGEFPPLADDATG